MSRNNAAFLRPIDLPLQDTVRSWPMTYADGSNLAVLFAPPSLPPPPSPPPPPPPPRLASPFPLAPRLMAIGGLPNLFMMEAYNTATVRSGECVKKKGQLVDEEDVCTRVLVCLILQQLCLSHLCMPSHTHFLSSVSFSTYRCRRSLGASSRSCRVRARRSSSYCCQYIP